MPFPYGDAVCQPVSVTLDEPPVLKQGGHSISIVDRGLNVPGNVPALVRSQTQDGHVIQVHGIEKNLSSDQIRP